MTGSRRTWVRVVVLTVLVVATVVVGGRAILHLSYFRVQRVVVTGLVHESTRDVEVVTHLDSHPPMIDLDNAALAADVEKLPWVLSASVREQWPHTVDITVVPETACGVAHGAHGALFLVGGDGRALSEVSVSRSLPLLVAVGATAASPWPFTGWAKSAARVAAELPPAFADQVAQVTITRDDDVRLSLTSPLTIDLGAPTDLGAKFAAIAAVLARPDLLHAGDTVDVSVPGSPTVSGPP